MNTYFKEFDAASYKLRYYRCWALFKSAIDNKEKVYYVVDVHEDRGWCLADLNGNGVWYGWDVMQPKYHFVKSALYQGTIRPHNVCSLRRKLVKTYHVGLNEGNYSFRWFGENATPMDFPDILRPISINIPEALAEDGPISNTLMLWKSGVYYLNQLVGMRKKKNFVVDPMFKSEMEDCLRGHECSIKL